MSIEAISNLNEISRSNMKDNFKIRIVDLMKNPDTATSDQIIALPTLVKKKPHPPVKIIGDLADHAAVKTILGIAV